MHEISQVKMSLKFAFTHREQHSETDNANEIPTITSYILVTDCTLHIFFPLEDTVCWNVVTESK